MLNHNGRSESQLSHELVLRQLNARGMIRAKVYSPSGIWTYITFTRGDIKKGQDPFWYFDEMKTEGHEGDYLIWVDAILSNKPMLRNTKRFVSLIRRLSLREMSKLSVPKLKRKEFLSVRIDKTGLTKEEYIAGYNTQGSLLPKDKYC